MKVRLRMKQSKVNDEQCKQGLHSSVNIKSNEANIYRYRNKSNTCIYPQNNELYYIGYTLKVGTNLFMEPEVLA